MKWIIGIVVVIVIGGGAYAIFHKSPAPAANNTTNNTAQNQPSTNEVILTKTSPTLGQYLTDPTGKALYTYNADTNGVSNCTGSCLAAWPPYTLHGSTSNLPAGITVITRTDNGDKQYAYHGKPLYYFASDSGSSVTGNGISNFQVAKPSS